jgi:hypothetical protein
MLLDGGNKSSQGIRNYPQQIEILTFSFDLGETNRIFRQPKKAISVSVREESAFVSVVSLSEVLYAENRG